MRYPIKLVSAEEAFGPDIKIAVQLNDEPAIIVPEECPECPPGCTPSMTHWQYWEVAHLDFGGTESSQCSTFAWGGGFGVNNGVLAGANGATVSFSLKQTNQADFRQEIHLILVPMIERCGHRIRFVRTGEVTLGATVDTSDAAGNNAEALYYTGIYFTRTPTHETMTAKVQIDLTDAAVGSETWTDIGPIVSMTNF